MNDNINNDLPISLNQYLNQHYTPETVKTYEREINIFLSNYPQANTAVYKDLVDYLGKLRNRYSNARTINNILSCIKVYYNYLSHTGQRSDNPAKSIRLRDARNRDIQLQDLFTAEELESLLNRKERFTNLSYRNKVLISLVVYQALHPGNMEALKLDDINLQQGTIFIKACAKTNSRELLLKPLQIMMFHQYIFEIRPKFIKKATGAEQSGDAGYLLMGERGNPMSSEDITKHIMRSFKDRFQGRKVNAQTIRQSVITNLLKSGNDIRVVQTFAGHKYPGTTEKYKQTNLDALKSAVNTYHPIK